METCSISPWCLSQQQVFIHWLGVEFISVIKPNNDDAVSENLLSAFMDTAVTKEMGEHFQSNFQRAFILIECMEMQKIRKLPFSYVTHDVPN